MIPWVFPPKEAVIRFTIRNAGIPVSGSIALLNATLKSKMLADEASKLDILLDPKSIDTKLSLRDSHLLQAEYFFVKKYPEIHFVSEQIQFSESGGKCQGKLSIRGRSRPLQFTFQCHATAEKLHVKGNFTLRRSDFNIGQKSFILADKVWVEFDCTAYPDRSN